MGLRYKTTKTVAEEKELYVPTGWGMYTRKGNRRMTEIAEEATERLTKAVEEATYRPDRELVVKELKRMFKKYKRLWDTKTYPESADTAVRCSIRSFAERLVKAVGYSRFDARKIEEEAYRG